MPKNKIVTLEEIGEISKRLKKQGKIIAQCHGCFDLLHPGHIKHFEAAKKNADILIVTLTPDRFVNKGPGRPIFNEQIRAETIAAIEAVDYVIINKWPTAVEVIGIIKPSLYVKGQDYKDKKADLTKGIFAEEDAVKKQGGKLLFTEEITFSSSSLINSNFSPYSPKVRDFLSEFKNKHNSASVLNEIEKMSKLKVMIIGDTIIDEYHYCNPIGKSTKSPTVSTVYLRSEAYAGGVLAVANHVQQLAAKVKLVTCLGEQNLQMPVINEKLSKEIDAKFFKRTDGPTNTKRRYLDKYRDLKIFEVTFMNDKPINSKLEDEVIGYLEKEIPKYDMVIITDFGHGFITPDIIKCIETSAKYLAVNAQTNSNNYGYNYITKYKNADYISIDERELRLPFTDNYGDINQLTKKLQKSTEASKVQITLGPDGTLWLEKGKFYKTPAFATSIKDSVGAGDAVLSVTALAAYLGTLPDVASFIGNCVGSLAVEIIGNEHPVYKKDLIRFIQYFLK
jgi:rfaE bifunctional protein kinase chain/domain/rfaE bifunctional protein nucleotidyltransferase chain/domain